MVRKTQERLDKAAVVTIHGTNDGAPSPDGGKWWEASSTFSRRLLDSLKGRGVDAEITPFIWSGANSAVAREKAALALVKFLAVEAARRPAVHVIAHSHGGNVVNDALARMGLPEVMRSMSPPLRLFLRSRKVGVNSVTTVGTPFFRSRLDRLRTFRPTAVFLLVAAAMMTAVPLLLGSVFALYNIDQVGAAVFASNAASLAFEKTLFGVTAVVCAVTILACSFLFRFALAEYLVQTRLRLTELYARFRNAAPVRINAIWHPNDEAIGFLQKVEAVQLEPLARGAMLSQSRRNAVVAGVRFAVFMLFAAPLAGLAVGAAIAIARAAGAALPKISFLSSVFNSAYYDVWPWLMLFGVASVAFGPIAFGLAYLVNRLLFGVLPEAFRPQINGFVGGTLIGMAFGRDGVETIGAVSPRSHNLDTVTCAMPQAVLDRMRVGASDAANRLIEKYRWTLFSVDGDSKADIAAMATDAMTWNSLIHTTYFDQPEIADMIAERIAPSR